MASRCVLAQPVKNLGRTLKSPEMNVERIGVEFEEAAKSLDRGKKHLKSHYFPLDTLFQGQVP